MIFIGKDSKQFKANLHSHTNLSDGRLTVDGMIAAYKERGYSVLAITDHEAPYDHSDKSDDRLLLITGYEAYIRPDENCNMDPFGPEIHMNLLAREPHNTAFVGFDPNFVKYMPPELAAQREKAGSLGKREFSTEYIQKFINGAREAGYLVTYNHPVWSMHDEADILALDGFFSLEIFNTGSMTINGSENNLPLYERMLRAGKFIGVHGADDNHNKLPLDDFLSDSFGAWTMIIAPELSYGAIIKALEDKMFYASTGPVITQLSVECGRAHLEFSDAQRVIMHITPKCAKNVYNSDGSVINSADFEIPDYAPWVYFSVIAADGTAAHTRAFTREEMGL